MRAVRGAGLGGSQSYERFWYGRKLWSKVQSTCRSLSRASLAYLATISSETERPEDDDLYPAFSRCRVRVRGE